MHNLQCPVCGQLNNIVNQCRCDPNNLPTSLTTSPRAHNLIRAHMDTASLLTSENEVFWVLDLEDPVGFAIACATDKDSNAMQRIAAQRDATIARSEIACQTVLLSLKDSQAVLRNGWNIAKPLATGRYLAVVTSGRLSVALVHSL